MEGSEALDRLAQARTGHLATVRPDGRPHVVVVTFALVGETVVTAIDHKPKTTQRLQRLINIEAHPVASFLVDGYAEDWAKLWWVRVDGPAWVHPSGDASDAAISALRHKYPQYRARIPDGPVLAVEVAEISSWASNP
jgi:PPOX class probable F420-dependent enzyme